MPQYQGVWNLQDAARLQSQQQWVTDPNFRNTTLLLQADNAAGGAQNNTFLDSSSNNLTVTRNGGSPGMTQGTFTPFSQGWSNFLGGYAVGSAAVFTSSTSTFTIEGWIFPTAAAISASNIPAVIGDMQPTSTAAFWSFGTLASGAVTFYWFDGGSKNATTSGTVPLNTWTHIAVSVNANAITIYINGVQQSLTGTTTLTNRTGSNASVAFGQFSNAGSLYTGYISNFSVLSGTAKYSGSFTPSTTPLPTNTTNQTLLFASSNGFVDSNTATTAKTFTIAGTPSVQPFAPFAPQFQYTQSGIGGSGYFDGTGDYLTLPNNATTTIGSSDYTFEGWFYTPAVSALQTLYTYGSGSGGFRVFFNLTSLWFLNGSTTIFQPTNVIRANEWIHVALVRSGSGTNNTAVWINGTRAAQQTNTTSFVAAPPQLGMEGTSSSPYTGYMSSVRLVKSALYNPANASIPIPTAPFTNSSSPAFLLNFTNAGIIDGTMDNVLETVGNASVSTSIVKYGSGSMFFDGTGDYLSAPANPNFNFGSGDFTIEFWLYPTSHPATVYLAGQTNSSDFAPVLCLLSNGRPGIAATSASGSWTINVTSTTTLVLNAWTHVAYVRFGNKWSVYINGVETVLAASTAVNTYTSTDPLGIGGEAAGTLNYPYFGYMDDVRITRGVARYLSNFTPPQVALPRQ